MAAIFNLRNFLFAAIFLLSAILNFYKLDKNPPGLYIDEVSIGVNAYSILTKGVDEHGVKYPVYFKAYGEYKLPAYIYLTAASIFLFGKNEFAVRFPSAFLGILTLIPFLLIVKKISKSKTLPLLATFILSVSPWFLHFVGPAFEAAVGLFFFIFGLYLYILFKKNHGVFFLFISLVSFVITLYTYNSYKIITPIIFLFLATDLFKAKYIRRYFLLLLIPLVAIFHSLLFNPSNVRFFQTSAFSGDSINNLLQFSKNYLSYYSLDFLFNTGDGINRHQFLNFGILTRWSLPFLLLGFYSLLREKTSSWKFFTLVILTIAPIPAALALPSPHTLRSLLMVVPYTLIISVGILYLYHLFPKFSKLLIVVLTAVFIYEFSLYSHYGFFHYPKTALIDWGGNYKAVAATAKKLSADYPLIAVHESLPFTIEYLRFYAEDLKPILLKSGQDKNLTFGNKKILLITSDTTGGGKPSDKLIETVYLPNDNKDIFAQFWEI